ncbi:MAG: hypothetical protein K5799_15410, partial [Erythrobacter sp.]|nr:hypothetical protein [Erythrobacter sp.]
MAAAASDEGGDDGEASPDAASAAGGDVAEAGPDADGTAGATEVGGDADDGFADGCAGVDACDDVACEDAGTDDDGCAGDAAAGWLPCCCAAAGAAIARTASATTNLKPVAFVANPVIIPRSLFLLNRQRHDRIKPRPPKRRHETE